MKRNPLLIISSALPFPPDAGDKLRIYYFLRELSQWYDITLLSFTRPETDRRDVFSALSQYCKQVEIISISKRQFLINCVIGLILNRSLIVYSYRSTAFVQALRRISSQPHQKILLYQIRAATAIQYLPKESNIVLDYTDALYKNLERLGRESKYFWIRWLYRREARLLRDYERHVGCRVQNKIVASKVDQAILTELGVPGVQVVQNGVELPAVPINSFGQNVMFIGSLAYPPNREAVEFILQYVWESVSNRVPHALLYIVGIPDQSLIRRYGKMNRVKFTGLVPNKEEYIRRCGVALSPLFSGTGIRNKVLEGMAYGQIVITTKKVADDIQAQSSDAVLVADTAARMIELTVSALTTPEQFAPLRQRAQKFVARHYRWLDKAVQIHELLDQSSTQI